MKRIITEEEVSQLSLADAQLLMRAAVACNDLFLIRWCTAHIRALSAVWAAPEDPFVCPLCEDPEPHLHSKG